MIYFTKRKKQDRFCVKSKPAIRQRMVSSFCASCLHPSFCFISASFCSLFPDRTNHARKKSNEDRLNIMQKHRPNTNNRFLI